MWQPSKVKNDHKSEIATNADNRVFQSKGYK